MKCYFYTSEELTLDKECNAIGAWDKDFDKVVPNLVVEDQPCYILFRYGSNSIVIGVYDISWWHFQARYKELAGIRLVVYHLVTWYFSGQTKNAVRFHESYIETRIWQHSFKRRTVLLYKSNKYNYILRLECMFWMIYVFLGRCIIVRLYTSSERRTYTSSVDR